MNAPTPGQAPVKSTDLAAIAAYGTWRGDEDTLHLLDDWTNQPESERVLWRSIADAVRMAVAAPHAAGELAAYEADIASLTDQRNRVSETADQFRAQVRNLRDALERCRDAASRSPAAVHTIASQALASSPLPGGDL